MDDTGARHARQNGFCTQIGNDRFTAWFATRASKSRLNFLDLLRAKDTPISVINDAALSRYMRASRSLAGPVISQLAMAQPWAHFANQLAWQAHLDRLGIVSRSARVTPDPVQIATEGGTIGAAFMPTASCATPSSSAMMPVNLTLADMRMQIHAERSLVHKLDTFTELHLQRTARVLRAHLVVLCRSEDLLLRAPTVRRRAALMRARFDRIFCRRTSFATLGSPAVAAARQ